MTPKQAAKAMDCQEYGDEGNDVLWDKLKASGLVAVFGASDDLMEFRGAIHDEIGAYGSSKAYVTKAGLIQLECQDDRCPHELRRMKWAKEHASAIEAIWSPDDMDCSWLMRTTLPHEPFDIMEDGELYCRGLVFSLADAADPIH